MRVKIISDCYIVGLAIAPNGVEASEHEYAELTDLFHNMSTARDGYEYKLTVNREWVEVPIDTDPDIDDTEAIEILMGGAE